VVLEKLKERMTTARERALPQSGIGQAAAYALTRWSELTRFAQPDFGHVEIDNNQIENGIRPSALGKRYGKVPVMESGAGVDSSLIADVASRMRLWFMKCGRLFRASRALDRLWPKNQSVIHGFVPAFSTTFP
jgi:hypothetical protein